jgi:hypothetical protein
MYCNFTRISENHAVYEVTWKNLVQNRQVTIGIMAHARQCCIIKTTDTHSQYVILVAFPQQQW